MRMLLPNNLFLITCITLITITSPFSSGMSNNPFLVSPDSEKFIQNDMPTICLIIPVLNEAEHIVPLFERIALALKGKKYAVYYIDDGSTDGTIALIEKLRQSQPENVRLFRRVKTLSGCQRGAALFYGMKKGLEDKENTIFVEMDGDLSHRPEELPDGIKRLSKHNCDVLIVSKYLENAGIVNRSSIRNFISRVNSLVMRLAIGGKISDYSNGYRFYNRWAAETLARHQPDYGSPIYLSEALSVWLSNGLKIDEVSGIYVGRGKGDSKVRLIDILKGIVAIFHIGLRYRLGKYKQTSIRQTKKAST